MHNGVVPICTILVFGNSISTPALPTKQDREGSVWECDWLNKIGKEVYETVIGFNFIVKQKVWTGWTYGQCHILWAMDLKICSWVRILSSTLSGPSTMMVLGFRKMGFQGCWIWYGWLRLQMAIFLRFILRFCFRVSMWLCCQQMTRYWFFSWVGWCFYVGFAYLHFFFLIPHELAFGTE